MTEKSGASANVWICLYFLASLALTIHNKWVLSRLNFRFPWILTAIHVSVSGVGSALVCKYSDKIEAKQLDRHAWTKLLFFSALYALNIAMSNVSLAHVSLSFHQIVRSTVPALILVLEYWWLDKRPTLSRKLSLIPLILGVTLATTEEFKDIEFTWLGLTLTLMGVVLAALKGVVTNVLMVGPLKMHPLQVIASMAAPAALQCIVYAYFAGELAKLSEIATHSPDLGNLVMKLAMNGLIAFGLNWVSFTANKKTSALTMTVVANVKQVISIALAIYVFHITLTFGKFVGIAMTLVGATWYSLAKTNTIKPKSIEEPDMNIPMTNLEQPLLTHK